MKELFSNPYAMISLSLMASLVLGFAIWHRNSFLWVLGIILVTLLCLPMLAHAGSSLRVVDEWADVPMDILNPHVLQAIGFVFCIFVGCMIWFTHIGLSMIGRLIGGSIFVFGAMTIVVFAMSKSGG
jgi:type IV secretory pathway VirB2 component (pilin)